jgi:hypothetical protein
MINVIISLLSIPTVPAFPRRVFILNVKTHPPVVALCCLLFAFAFQGCCPKLSSTGGESFRYCQIDKMVEMLVKDVDEAVGDPEFVAEKTFRQKWKNRTDNWDRLLEDLIIKAQEQEKPNLAKAAENLKSTVKSLNSGEPYRRVVLNSLKKRTETLKNAWKEGQP